MNEHSGKEKKKEEDFESKIVDEICVENSKNVPYESNGISRIYERDKLI